MNKHLIRAAANGARIILFAAAGLALMTVPTLAQQVPGVPKACAGKSGAALDQCVRDNTPSQIVRDLKPVNNPPKRKEFINCEQVVPADKGYCVRRNEALIECRNSGKHPDFKKCFDEIMQRAPRLRAEDCAGIKPALRAQCPARNKNFETCSFDPYNYFTCLTQKAAKK